MGIMGQVSQRAELAQPANQPRHYGCWVAYQPEMKQEFENETIDFVFVHGITGTQTGTWTTEKNSQDILWPRDLPRRIPNCRVILFGYDADVVRFWAEAGQNRLRDHATSLFGALGDLRRQTKTTKRPIIFIAHSMGGLVVQNALTLSNYDPAPHFSDIFTSTFAIAFLGTPNRGAGLASWADLASKFINPIKRTNRSLISVLRERSEVLDNVQTHFHTLIHNREQTRQPPYPIQLCCFFEEMPLRGVCKVVERESGSLDGWPRYSIHANHMNMSKFTDEGDPNFTRVYGELWGWAEDLKKPRANDGTVGPAVQVPSPPVPEETKKRRRKSKEVAAEIRELEAQISEVQEELRGRGGGETLRRELDKLERRKEKLDAKL